MQKRGRHGGIHASDSRNAGPVCCNGGFGGLVNVVVVIVAGQPVLCLLQSRIGSRDSVMREHASTRRSRGKDGDLRQGRVLLHKVRCYLLSVDEDFGELRSARHD